MKTISRLGPVVALLVALAVALFGCGGGGGGSTGSTTNLNTFITDDLTPVYDQVWVTLYSIDLVKSDDTVVNVFTSATGEQVNLRALNTGAASIYRFLGTTPIPTGTYKGFQVTLGKTVTLYAVGATTPTTVLFPDALDTGVGKSLLKVNFAAPRTFAEGENFPLDFNLKKWEVVAGRLVWEIVHGSGGGFDDPNHHEKHEIKGTIRGISGAVPNQTFSLVAIGDSDRVVHVTTSAKTVVVSRDPSTNPSLADGQVVEVVGRFDSATKTFLALLIHIKPDAGSTEQKAKGLASALDPTGGMFDMQVFQARGFVPAERKIHVKTTDATRFIDDAGVSLTSDQFYAQLAALGAAAVVEIEGTYDEANLFRAVKAKVEDEHDGVHEGVELEGNVTVVTPPSGFKMQLHNWSGFADTAGRVVPVTTDGATVFEDLSGGTMTAEQFYAALRVGAGVKVKGRIQDGGNVLARLVRIRKPEDGSGGDTSHEAKGVVGARTPADHSFEINLVEWEGFASTIGANVHVMLAPSCTFRDPAGNSITEEQFFARLHVAPRTLVNVEGVYDAGHFTAKRARVKE